MAEISASLVKELREMTGLGMMECKRALTETEGDIKKAEELLRIKSGAKASKAASRQAAEGTIGVYVAPDASVGALVEFNCETDFAARNVDLLAMAAALAKSVAENNPADVAALMATSIDGELAETRRAALVQKVGENMTARRFVRVAGGKVASYMHGGGRIGVLVAYEGNADIARDVAMHLAASVASTRAVCVSKDQVPAELIENERKIFAAQAAESGKPVDIIAKMVEGRINKYLAEVTLLGQPFVKDPEQTVEKVLKAANTTIKSFQLYVVGEGIEKKVVDYAAEVAAAAKGL
ncbi:translation elongation factor Ts [Casimicrobium huifangae]|uniref:translation elongation factor Ts n=1 Tax=Casimicrobium huifangae TaxID=2591109 RepID=UPI0012EC8FB8|nr:translation elongation factor Ts [Casimicrobium huifangae]HOB02355.1 translation elongation factor Ts [Casimicrobium huifangae]